MKMVEYVNIYNRKIKGTCSRKDYDVWSKHPEARGRYKVVREYDSKVNNTTMIIDSPEGTQELTVNNDDPKD
jgi:hypothetical protein